MTSLTGPSRTKLFTALLIENHQLVRDGIVTIQGNQQMGIIVEFAYSDFGSNDSSPTTTLFRQPRHNSYLPRTCKLGYIVTLPLATLFVGPRRKSVAMDELSL